MSAQKPTQQAVGYSGLYPNVTTSWTTSGSKIMVSRSDQSGPAKLFVSKGVRYQPTPINIDSSLAGTPMGDFFYSGANTATDKTQLFYEPIWDRDVGPSGLMRTAGINNLAVYTTYNVPPSTMSTASGQKPTLQSASTAEMAKIDWSALGPVRYEEAGGQMYPTYLPQGASAKVAPPYWYHLCHDRFLDICWNDGDPIYVWLAVGVSPYAFFTSNPAPADGFKYTQIQDYYRKSAKWLATAYANHPAVAGFIISNETNTSGSLGTNNKEAYWHFLNEIHDILKTAAPTKLTAVGFQDNPDTLNDQLVRYASTPVPGQPAPATNPLYVQADGKLSTTVTTTEATSRDIYKVDIWGWNLYGEANPNTDIIKFAKSIYGTSKQKPILITEIGIPASMRFAKVKDVTNSANGEPYYGVPNGYVAKWNSTTQKLEVSLFDDTKHALGVESPAVVTWDPKMSLPIPKQYYAGGLILYNTETQVYSICIGNPAKSTVEWTTLDKTKYETLLDAIRENGAKSAGPGLGLYGYLLAAEKYNVANQNAKASDQLLSGVMLFEWIDEWFKWVDPTASNQTAELAAGVHDFRDSAIQPWGPADAQFFTVWDEEWFGICSTLPTKRSSTDQAITSDGWLNGGADTLTPRAAYYAAKLFFTGSA